MKLIEDILEENLTWEQAVDKMINDFRYVTKTGCNNIVYVINEDDDLYAVDGDLEQIYKVGTKDTNYADLGFTNSTYNTVQVSNESVCFILDNLY